jgi:hypothetical protein
MVIVVEPRDGELAIAHEGRRMRLLGSRSRPEHLRQLQAEVVAMGKSADLPRLHLLALTCDMDPQTYAAGHSMLASLRVAGKPGETKDHGAAGSESLSRRLGMLTQRAGAYLCTDCIEEDISGPYKHSWFRREHHLIGVDWCPRHKVALHRVDAPQPFDEVPQTWLNEGRTSKVSIDSPVLPQGRFAERYLEVAVWLLDRRRPVPCTAINKSISEKAKSIGLRVSETGRRSLLSDRLIEVADARWLGRHLQGIDGKPHGQVFRRIDMTASSQSVPAAGDAYVFALAALFETSAEAIEAVSLADAAATKGEVNVNKLAGKSRGDDFWHGQVWPLYVQCRGSHTELARRLGMDRTHLSAKLKAMGLPSLSDVGNSPKWRAMLRFNDGATIEEACAAEQIEVKTLSELIRACSARAVSAARLVLSQEPVTSSMAQHDVPSSNRASGPIHPQALAPLSVRSTAGVRTSECDLDLVPAPPSGRVGDCSAGEGKSVKAGQASLQLVDRVAEV